MIVMPALSTRERVALDLLKLLPDGWRVGRACWNPGTRRWAITARPPHPGRGMYPETITGTGDDELAAMIDLRIRLDDRQCGRSSPTSTDLVERRSFREPRNGPGRSRVAR